MKKINLSVIKNLKLPPLKKIPIKNNNVLTNLKAVLGKVYESKIFKTIILSLIVLLSLVQIVFGVLIYKFQAEDKVTRLVAKIIPFPIAVVSYDIITYNQYLAEKDYIHHFYNSTQQEGVDLAEIDKQILDQLVENKLIAFEARANKIKVSNSDVDAAYKEIADQNGGESSVNKVLNELYGIDVKKFKSLVKTQILRDKVSDQLIAKVKVRHILVRVDSDADETKVAEAKTKIDGYLTEIKNGSDFAEVAKRSSEDVGSADQGGLLEPFAQGEMVEAFSKAAFETSVGQISDPIRTEFGWHIIKVESKTGKINKTFTDWLKELKENSLILKLIR